MAIVKGLIEKMGGTIEVKSEEGIGSTFILRIPFKLAPAPDIVKKTAAQMDISGLNLLLVEDNELNAEIAETLLSDEGANLTVAEDGLQAVRMFQGRGGLFGIGWVRGGKKKIMMKVRRREKRKFCAIIRYSD